MLHHLRSCYRSVIVTRQIFIQSPRPLSASAPMTSSWVRPFSNSPWLLSQNDDDSDDDDMMGHIASKTPFPVALVPGKKYFWCKCGQSKKQPWCDGSHKGTGFAPVKFTVEIEDAEAYLCGCKQTGTRPYCDGTHATPLVQDYQP